MASGGDEHFKCESCSKTFNERKRYNQHRNTHLKPYKCTQCQRGFALRRDVTRHETSRHRVAKHKFPCTIAGCNFKAIRKDHLSQHLRKAHRLASIQSSRCKDTAGCSHKEPEGSFAHFDHEQSSISVFDAAAAGDIELLERLLQAGTDLFSIAEDGSSILHAAAMAASAPAVQYLLSKGLDPTLRNHKRNTPLEEAALSGNWNTMSVLLPQEIEASSDVTLCGYYLIQSGNLHAIAALLGYYGQRITNQHKIAFVRLAIYERNSAILRLLLEYKELDINTSDDYGRTVLHDAAWIGNPDILRLLLDYPGIDVNVMNGSRRRYGSAIPIAIGRGHEDVVRNLLAHDTIELNEMHWWIALCMRCCRYRIGKIILEDARVGNNDSMDPLLRAIILGREDDVISLLQDAQTVIGISENRHLAHLNWAIGLHYSAIAKRLINFPTIDINYKSSGRSPIEVAATTGDFDTSCSLLDHPSFDPSHARPVYEAVKGGQFRTLELLLSQANIDPNKSQPLVEASKRSNLEMVRMLLSCSRIDVNQRKYCRYETALSTAVQRGNMDIIWLLLKHEGQPTMDINAVVGWVPKKRTALDIATRNNAKEIVEILRSFGAKTLEELEETQKSHDSVAGSLAPDNDFLGSEGFVPNGHANDEDETFSYLDY